MKFDYEKTANKVIDFIGGTMFLVMIVFTGINVFCMWIIGKRYSQLSEVVLSSFVWVSYISLGKHYRYKQCISVDFLVELLPPKSKKIIEIIQDVLVFCIGAVVLYLAIKLTGKSMNKYTAIIKISYFWIDLGVVLGFISLLLNIILKNIPSKLPKNEGNRSSQLIKDKE